jgi:hypothetical protein
VSVEVEPQVARTADRLRDEFLVTLRELERRGHRAMDVRALLRDNRRVVLAAGAGLAAMVIVILGASVALSRSRPRGEATPPPRAAPRTPDRGAPPGLGEP